MNLIIIDTVGGITDHYIDNIYGKKEFITDSTYICTTDRSELCEKNYEVHKIYRLYKKEYGILKKIINYCIGHIKLNNSIKKSKIDIIDIKSLQVSPIDYLLFYLIKKKGVKIIITVQDVLPFKERFYDKTFYNLLYDLADILIVHTDYSKRKLLSVFQKLNYRKINIIPHANHEEYLLKKMVTKDEAKRKFNIQKEGKVILFFGMIRENKGLKDLINAFNDLQKEMENVHLIIAGKGKDEEVNVYKTMIHKLNLDNKIITHFYFIKDEDVNIYFQAADIVVLPYLEIYQSGILHIAFSFSRPVIATDVGSMNEIIEDSINGFLIKPGNVSELFSKMRYALSNDDLLTNLTIGAGETAKRYSQSKIAIQYKKLYKKTLEG